LIKAKTSGLIIDAKKDIGQIFAAGTPVISMIEPGKLRVVGQIEEDKGLSDIVIGQAATFTIDAFGSQQFSGVVDEITPTSNDSGVAFSISDKRATKKFDVKIRFNALAHPEFKNGMSAKIVIYKN
jgi:multidrug resistance efflux pump